MACEELANGEGQVTAVPASEVGGFVGAAAEQGRA